MCQGNEPFGANGTDLVTRVNSVLIRVPTSRRLAIRLVRSDTERSFDRRPAKGSLTTGTHTPPTHHRYSMLIACLDTAASSEFDVDNLPLGVFSNPPHVLTPRCCTRLGDIVIDLAVLEEAGLFDDIPGLGAGVFCQETINAFIEHPSNVWSAFRKRMTDILSRDESEAFQSNFRLQEAAFHLVTEVQMHLPIKVGDYTDFYASREHATNVG